MSDMCKSASRRSMDFPVIELNHQSLEILEKFCYLGDTIEGMQWTVLKRRSGVDGSNSEI